MSDFGDSFKRGLEGSISSAMDLFRDEIQAQSIGRHVNKSIVNQTRIQAQMQRARVQYEFERTLRLAELQRIIQEEEKAKAYYRPPHATLSPAYERLFEERRRAHEHTSEPDIEL